PLYPGGARTINPNAGRLAGSRRRPAEVAFGSPLSDTPSRGLELLLGGEGGLADRLAGVVGQFAEVAAGGLDLVAEGGAAEVAQRLDGGDAPLDGGVTIGGGPQQGDDVLDLAAEVLADAAQGVHGGAADELVGVLHRLLEGRHGGTGVGAEAVQGGGGG